MSRTLKLSQIVINKFRHFRQVELYFDKYTSVNGKLQSGYGKIKDVCYEIIAIVTISLVPALASLAEAIKFVLDCSELPANEFAYICEDDNEDEDDEDL